MREDSILNATEESIQKERDRFMNTKDAVTGKMLQGIDDSIKELEKVIDLNRKSIAGYAVVIVPFDGECIIDQEGDATAMTRFCSEPFSVPTMAMIEAGLRDLLDQIR